MEMAVSPTQALDFMNIARLDAVPRTNILVVEDDPFWQLVIERSIGRASETSKVSFATNAKEAIHLIEHNWFNLIIADQYLDGDRTGFELWHDCQRRGIKAPFLLTSGSVNFSREIVKDLPIRFVSKPFVASEIRRTLKDLIRVDLPNQLSLISPLARLNADGRRMELSLLLATLALLSLFMYSTIWATGKDRFTPIKEELIVSPPAMDHFKSRAGHIASQKASFKKPKVKAFDPHKIFTPELQDRISSIIRRADDLNSNSSMDKRLSNLKLLSDSGPIFKTDD